VTARGVFVAAGLVGALAGCGGREGGVGGGGATGAFPPTRAAPDGVVWDALGWVPASKASAAEVTVVDAAAARAALLAGKDPSQAEGLPEARRALVHGLGLPEDAARVVVTFKERDEDRGRALKLRAVEVTSPLEEVRKAAAARGASEASLDGVPAWRVETPAGAVVAAWSAGWLLLASPEHPEEVRAAIAARAGKDSLRALDGLADAVANLPDTLPVQVEWGPKFGDFGPGVTPPRAAVSSISADDAETATVAFDFASEAERAAARAALERAAAVAVKAAKADPAVFAARGRVLLMKMTGRARPDALARRARHDLSRLHAVLRSRREGPAGRFPTTQEGLAALAADPYALDDWLGVLPKDPWGHAYHYASPHPKSPDDVDLRSAGPDGEIDTEDDVFEEE
jgi:hypothetical protein